MQRLMLVDFSIEDFLTDNRDELVKSLKEHFHKNLEQRQDLNGYYLNAYDNKLKLKMKAFIMHEFGNSFNLDAEQQLMLESEELEQIINRSIYE